MFETKLIRIKNIAGMLYTNDNTTDTIIVYGPGAPIVPDNGNLPDAPVIMRRNVHLLVVDYIGYGRSSGICTPENCINTFLVLYDQLTKGCEATNNYETLTLHLRYKRVIFIGRSFGGTYIPLLPRYNKAIKELCLIYPAVNNKLYGTMQPEESNEDFMRAMEFDGYKYLYRGIMHKRWQKHLDCEDGLSPMDNITYLEKVKMFIAHGKKDTCLHYSRTVNYFEKIIKHFPNKKNEIVLKLYPNSGHTFETSNPAVNDFLDWINIK